MNNYISNILNEKNFKIKLYLESVEDTENLGRILSQYASEGDIIKLNGHIGSGKTCMCRGFIREFFGNQELTIPSPT